MFWVNLLIYVLLALYVIVCVLLMLVILMQRSKQDGLGAAFGGGMMDSAFGPSTSNVLVKSTVGLAVIFFVLTLTLAFLYALTTSSSVIAREIDVQDSIGQESAAITNAIKKAEEGDVPGGALPGAPTPAKETVSGAGTLTEGEAADGTTPAAPPADAAPGQSGSAPVSEAKEEAATPEAPAAPAKE